MFLTKCNRFTPRSVFVFTVFWMQFPIRAAMRTFLGQLISEQHQPQEFGAIDYSRYDFNGDSRLVGWAFLEYIHPVWSSHLDDDQSNA